MSCDWATHGIAAYGVHLPRHRLRLEEGTRIAASYDEDTTTMGFEAARRALGGRPGSLYLATTAPAYADKTNAAAIHSALGLGREGCAIDMAGSARSSIGALRAAAATGGLAVLSDMRGGRPDSSDERDGADGAVALRFARDASIAEIVGDASSTLEILDRWRLPGGSASQQWEERFGVEEYVPLARETASRALSAAAVEQPDHVVVSSPHARAAKALRGELAGRIPPDPLPLGYAGAADPGVRLAAVLDRAGPGETVLLVIAADGCDALVLRTTPALAGARSGVPVTDQLAEGRHVPYMTYLTWRGFLEREPPRRPEPDRPAAPPAARSEAWKFGFVGSRCLRCGRVHAPPRRVCVGCAAVDQMEPAPLANALGTVALCTVDRLAFSHSPPVTVAVVDFDGGGRSTLEVTDAGADELAPGDRVELAFRRLYTAGGVHNYFWKVRPSLG